MKSSFLIWSTKNIFQTWYTLKIVEDNSIINKNLTNFPLGFIGPDINDETIKIIPVGIKVG